MPDGASTNSHSTGGKTGLPRAPMRSADEAGSGGGRRLAQHAQQAGLVARQVKRVQLVHVQRRQRVQLQPRNIP